MNILCIAYDSSAVGKIDITWCLRELIMHIAYNYCSHTELHIRQQHFLTLRNPDVDYRYSTDFVSQRFNRRTCVNMCNTKLR